MSVVHIAVSGIDPAPQGSKRHVGHGRMVEASKRCKPWRHAVAASAQQQMRDQKRELLTGACSVSVVFRFKRPKSHFTTNGQLKAAAPKHCVVKRNDIDKCCRSTLDGLVDGGLLADDSLVIELVAWKGFCAAGEQPGVLMRIRPIE